MEGTAGTRRAEVNREQKMPQAIGKAVLAGRGCFLFWTMAG